MSDQNNANPNNGTHNQAGSQAPGTGTFGGGNSNLNEPDYKEKFSNSTRENQRIMQENQNLQADLAERNKKLQDLTNVREPTEDEMRAKYSTWDAMTDTEKMMARDNFKMGLQLNKTASMALDATITANRKEQLASVYANPTFKVIADHFRTEFEQYVRKPEHNDMNLSFVAKAFMIDFSEEIADKMKPAPGAPNNNQGLEHGSGGEPPVKPSLSDEDIENIKRTDHKRYQQLIRQGVI